MFPESIVILGYSFALEFVDTLPSDQMGESCIGERYIRIKSGLRDDVALEVFYHELTHCFLDITGVGHILTEDQNEAIAQAMGACLTLYVSRNEVPAIRGSNEQN